MSQPGNPRSANLEAAVAQLKRDPSRPVQARVDGLDVELRVVVSNDVRPGVGTRLAAIGPWEGIGFEELAEILRAGRESGGSAPSSSVPEPP